MAGRLEFDDRAILECRIARGWNREDLVARAGISRGLLTSIECGTAKFWFDPAKRIAAALDIPFDKVTRPALDERAPSKSVDPTGHIFAGRGSGTARKDDSPRDKAKAARRRTIRQAPAEDLDGAA